MVDLIAPVRSEAGDLNLNCGYVCTAFISNDLGVTLPIGVETDLAVES